MDDHRVGDACELQCCQTLLGLPETAPTMTTSVRSSTRMERSCSAFTRGVPDHPSLKAPIAHSRATASSFSRIDDFDMALPRGIRSSPGKEQPHMDPNTETMGSLRDRMVLRHGSALSAA